MDQLARIPYENTACYADRIQMSMAGELFVKNGTSVMLDGETSFEEMNPLIKDFIMSHGNGHSGFEEMITAFLPHLLALLVLMVFVSRSLHYSLRWLKQPLIVCQLITGILLFSFLPRPKGTLPTTNEKNHINSANRRVEQVIGAAGVMFNLFIGAVKLDVSSVYEFGGKKPLIIGVASQFITLGVGSLLCGFFHKSIEQFFGVPVQFLMYALQPLCSTYPVVLCDIFTEMGLLNTELGRLALSSSMMQCFAGWVFTIALNVITQARVAWKNGFIALVCIITLITIVILVIRPYSVWIVNNTRSNARVRGRHIFMITLLVLVLSLLDEIVGFAYPDGAIIMGLTMPHGAPLGTALIERVDLVASEIFLPLAFMHTGILFDWEGLVKELHVVLGVEFFVLITVLTKLLGCAVAAKYCKMSLKDGLIIGLMMNFRGLIDVLVFLSLEGSLIDKSLFTALVLSTIGISGICVPLVSFFYKPLHIKKKKGSRTVQKMHSSTELHMMTCFYDDKPVSALIDFLESSTSTETNMSICIHTLHIIELQGSAASSLILHRNNQGIINPARMDRVHNHFIALQQNKKGVSVFPYTSYTPLKNMHQDVCSLILEKNIALVIVPYPRKNSFASLEDDMSMRDLVPLVLQQAPCSVGIMVHHGTTRIMSPGSWQYHVGVLFWGGPDDREAIAIASHLARNPGVYLNVLCFVSSDRANSRQKDVDNESQEESVDNESWQEKDVNNGNHQEKDADYECQQEKDVDNESRQEKDVESQEEKDVDNEGCQEKDVENQQENDVDNEGRQEKDVKSQQDKDVESQEENDANNEGHKEKDVESQQEKDVNNEGRQEKDVESQQEKDVDDESYQEKDIDAEKLADDKVIKQLQRANAENERVMVREIIMENVIQTCSVIHGLGAKNDLLIVGQTQNHLLLLAEGLERWTESRELGVIGDFLATSNMCTANVLVVQQHKV